MSGLIPTLAIMARALVLTIAIELPLGLVFCDERTWREAAVITLAQVVTNPSVQLVSMLVSWHPTLPLLGTEWGLVLLCEAAACVVEGMLYRAADVTRHPFAVSLALNATSFCLGLALAAAGLLS